ncbi:MAG: DUF4837 domain-containing protein [Ignavibacteriae bacterium HGW-Ignavibacteriae-2]|nr:DUF4837 family protein [Bacteroidota bacterium]PKL87550.1 MAG: DUF4837 domain-containing protein [Ignavibacteriae bacterium HGW-Ignavibacteriae-2]
MKQTYIPQILLLFIIIILMAACGVKNNSIGKEDEIIVIADSVDYLKLEPALYETFSKVIYTPQPENLFEIIRRPFESLKNLKNRKNIIIIAPMDGKGFTADYVRSMLDSTVFSMVKSGKEFVFNKYDLWAKDQLVMVLTAPNLSDLEKNILTQKEKLLYHFKKISDKRLSRSLYNSDYERKDVEAQFLRDYDWIIYVQSDYIVSKESPEDKFVWLRRAMNTDMERWFFIHWIDNATPEWLNKDSINAIRDRLTQKYYRTTDNSFVSIAQDQLTTVREVNFQGNYALMAHGFWRFSDKSGGGPFISYTFYDEQTRRIYMLDGSVYAPKYYKKQLLQQVDVTLQSFIPGHKLNPEKREDLMKELK